MLEDFRMPTLREKIFDKAKVESPTDLKPKEKKEKKTKVAKLGSKKKKKEK